MSSPSPWIESLATSWGLPAASLSVKRVKAGSLWAGYGRVEYASVRLPSRGNDAPLPPHVSTLLNAADQEVKLVVKVVTPPSGSGVSHERKLRSYATEAAWYRDHVPTLLQDPLAPPLPVPLLITSNTPRGGAGCWFTFVLSDLRGEFPISQGRSLDVAHLKAALTWLARLHACFWEAPQEKLAGLWLPQGSYWHLSTRLEELESMDAEWSVLKAVAHKVDRLLHGQQPDGSLSDEFMTVCHGDFKSANILFARDASKCAAYDFQYVGRSYGMRDVAYLFISSADEKVLEDAESEELLLRHYHEELLRCLQQRQGIAADAGARYTFQILKMHYDWATLDHWRFLVGWGMWGAAGWGARRARALLAEGVGV